MGVLSSSPSNMDACIEECLRCMRACEECLAACLQEPDVQARVKCIQTLHDCVEICLTAAHFMAGNSPHSSAICNVCATICEECATHCEMFKDPHCQECANICHSCAEMCRKMSA